MDPSHGASAATVGPQEEADGAAAAADIVLARRVVAWLTQDVEGRRILRILAEHPRMGSALLLRRMWRADPRPDPLPERVLTGRRVESAPRDEPLPWEGLGHPPGLARQLSLTGAGLLAGGFAAFMLGVLTLGKADPGFPPLSVFGAVLMLLSALPPVAANLLRMRNRGATPMGSVRGPLLTFTAVVAAMAVAAVVAAVTAR